MKRICFKKFRTKYMSLYRHPLHSFSNSNFSPILLYRRFCHSPREIEGYDDTQKQKTQRNWEFCCYGLLYSVGVVKWSAFTKPYDSYERCTQTNGARNKRFTKKIYMKWMLRSSRRWNIFFSQICTQLYNLLV